MGARLTRRTLRRAMQPRIQPQQDRYRMSAVLKTAPAPRSALLGGRCKAYPSHRFREFPGWAERARGEFADDHMLYLQDDFTVTDGVYRGERIVFDDVCDEWRRFCRQRLNFRVAAAAAPASADAAMPD